MADCSSSGSIRQTTLQNTWGKRRRPPSQRWKAFLRNHAIGIASIDTFVLPLRSGEIALITSSFTNAQRSFHGREQSPTVGKGERKRGRGSGCVKGVAASC
jgi:hypothetical protein